MKDIKFNHLRDNTWKRYYKNILRPIYYIIRRKIWRIKEIIFSKHRINAIDIPIIINSFNQLDYLRRLIGKLEEMGYYNIYIIDNASSYPPLLEYYRQTQYTVFKLDKNMGYLALWKTNIYKKFINDFYVYTDPDILPIENCPIDFMEYFYSILIRYPNTTKVGFSLKIDDIPDHYSLKQKVLDWESQFWKYKIDDNLYEAPIDTTFAMYRPFSKGKASIQDNHIRTGYPYQARHLPWYINEKLLTDNEIFYKTTANKSHTWRL